MSLSGLELIKAYRENPERYLPMIDHTWEMPAVNEYGEVNIGWYAGLLEENRPFFAVCWAVDHMTTLTIYVSAKGIEDKTAEELDQWFQDIGYFSYRDQEHYPADVGTILGLFCDVQDMLKLDLGNTSSIFQRNLENLLLECILT